MKKEKHIKLIAAGFAWGSGYMGTGRGPKALMDWGLIDHLKKSGLDNIDWGETINPSEPNPTHDPNMAESYQHVLPYSKLLEGEISKLSFDTAFPTLIGGDHSCAMGYWSGLINALDAHEQFGLIWVDAHMDAHTPMTASTGKWGGHLHGTPVAHLLGFGDRQLCELGSPKTKINPKHLVQIGIRSCEEAEEKLLKSQGVRVMTAEEVKNRGLYDCLLEAFDIVSQAPSGWGTSIDLDAFDPKDCPGVGTPEMGGLRIKTFCQAWQKAKIPDRFYGVELSEYNMMKDENHITAQHAADLLAAILKDVP